MVPFQQTVSAQMAFGVPGELFDSGPKRSRSYILNSALASYNVFGSAFSVTSQGIAAAGNVSGTAVYAGILVNPKGSVSFGGSGGPLTPTLQLANNSQAELLTMGSIVVALPAAAAIGDVVIFDNTTGLLSTIAPGASLPTGKSFAFAIVEPYTIPSPSSGTNLAVITLTPYTAPVAA